MLGCIMANVRKTRQYESPIAVDFEKPIRVSPKVTAAARIMIIPNARNPKDSRLKL